MKNRWKRIALCTMSLVVLAGLASSVMAGGGINHKITVKNETDRSCQVYVYRTTGRGVAEPGDSYTIGPGQSHVWETGIHCPVSLKGTELKTNYDIKIRCTVGTEVSSISACSATCWSSDWFIRKDNDYGDYHFYKE